MKHFSKLLALMAACAIGVGTYAWATDAVGESSADLPEIGSQATVVDAFAKPFDAQSFTPRVATEAPRALRRNAPHKAISTVSDLTGTYVLTYEDFSENVGDGGNEVTITKGTGDTIVINNFYSTGIQVKAAVNLSSKTLTIPNQVVANVSTYGNVDFATIASTGKPDRSTPVTGSFTDEGVITLDGSWGIFVMEGDYADAFFYAGCNTLFEKPNGTIEVARADTALTYTWSVVLEQTGSNLVTVKNLGNHGLTIDIVLGADSSATIASQMGWAYASYGNFYTYAADWTTTKLTNATITGTATTDAITWDNWTLYSTTKKVYVAKYASAKITGITFTFPTSVTTPFTGSGTQADPFRIRTLNDLIYLSDTVNNNTNQPYGTAKKPWGKMFEGQYFVVENDIDMTGYRFTPIGNDYGHRFAGIIDGQNHTLTGLNVNTSSTGYAGLFGFADTTSVIKNFVFANPKVSSAATGCGTAAGWSNGTIENVVVTGGEINNSYLGTGGVVGVSNAVKNSSFQGTVTSTNGTVGGIVGQSYGAIDGCHVIGTVKSGGASEGATAGGIVGTLYNTNSSCSSCYFYGYVDGTLAQNVYCGGIVGRSYAGPIDGCFAVARVTSYYTNGISGGICGYLIADMSNCYAIGYMNNGLSTYVGGLVGKVAKTNLTGGGVKQMTIKNSYFAGAIFGSSSGYEPATSTRGIVGVCLDGAEPVIENCYYDKQLCEPAAENYGKLTSEMTTASGLSGLSTDTWTFTAGYYPRLKALADNDAAKVGASVLTLDATFPDNSGYVTKSATVKTLGSTQVSLLVGKNFTNTGNHGTLSSGKYELNGTNGYDYVTFYNNDLDADQQPYTIPLNVTPAAFTGSGTAADPFQIKTKADVMLLGNLTTGGQNFLNVYFEQLNDIDMESDESFPGISSNYNMAHSVQFNATYNGAGHTLKNLRVNSVAWTGSPTQDDRLGELNTDDCKYATGFVGILGASGTIKNLTIDAGSSFDLYAYGAAFAGMCYGKITNCRNYAPVNIYQGIGAGIAGYTDVHAVIDSCLNAGDITGGYQTYGGITGMSYGTVLNSMNIGAVVAKAMSTAVTKTSSFNAVGGIAGRALGCYFKNVANAGHIEAAGGNAGGLFGYYKVSYVADDSHAGANDTYNAVNYGTVFSPQTTVGGIGGNGRPANATIENCYYDIQITGIGAGNSTGMSGVTSKNTTELTSGTPLDGLDASVWTFAQGKYPVLTLFATDERVQEAAKTIIGVTVPQLVTTLTSNVTLTSGPTWSLVDGSQFSISGTTLKVPEVTDATATDTLMVTNGKFHTAYALTAVMEVPLNGSGTEADPFQIVDPYTWDTFAHYMENTGNAFNGQYVKIMNDIDFTDTTFVPFEYFEGHLLGNNANVSGIKYTTTATYQGAIKSLGANGTVENLTLGGTLTASKSYAGGFFGQCSGTVTNCVNNINVTATAATVGGFAGYATGSAVFNGCVNNGTITTSKGNGAGFVGGAEAGVTFIDCINNGAVTNTGSVKNTAGFLANGNAATYIRCQNNAAITANKAKDVSGFQAYAAGSGKMVFNNCINAGEINCASEAGGMLASMPTTGDVVAIIADSCANTANINCLVKGSYGAAGLFYRITPYSVIQDCENTGNITASGSTYYCGGIWASYVKGDNEAERAYARRCVNKGNITMVGSSAMGIGAISAYSTVEDCYNMGNITADICASGIGHIMGIETQITNCWNSGNITVTKNGAGGICGYGYYSAIITNCFNTGDITAATNAGGLGGQTLCKYVNCYNRGNVKADANVGGLLGMSLSTTNEDYAPCSFYNCYNAGVITVIDTNCGNLIGNYSAWSTDAGNVIQDTYYITDFTGTLASDGVGGTATTVKELAATESMPGDWTYCDEYTYPIIKGMEDNACAKTFAVAVVLYDGDTYDNVTGRFYMGEQDNVTWTASTDSIYINDYAFIGGPVDKMYTPVVMTATDDDDLFHAYWYLQMNAETGLDEKQLADRQLIGTRYYNITGGEVTEPQPGNIYIRVNQYNDGTQTAVKVRR